MHRSSHEADRARSRSGPLAGVGVQVYDLCAADVAALRRKPSQTENESFLEVRTLRSNPWGLRVAGAANEAGPRGRGEEAMATRALWLPWRRDRSTEVKARPEAAVAPRAPGDEDAELRALREADSLAVRQAELERRAQTLSDRERNLAHEAEELKQAKRVQRRELERLSSLTAAQARQLLIAEVEQEARQQAGLRLAQIE